MAGLCEGRVVVVTGGARGIGREHCLLFAKEGAKVVVNDLGGDVAGSSGELGPAQEVAEEIKAMGGEAVANGDDVKVGQPMLDGAKVTAEVLEQGRHKKIKIVKFRRRKHSRKQQGHRQWYTAVKITGIQG